MHLPAPKARSPEDDQSAAAGFRFPPMEIYEQLTSVMTLNDSRTDVSIGVGACDRGGKKVWWKPRGEHCGSWWGAYNQPHIIV